MKKWSARLLALALCFALVLGEGSIVSAAESVGDSSEVATEEVVEETTEEEVVSEEVSEEATEEVSEEASEEATEEVSEEASEEATEEVSEEASEEATEEVSEEISEEATEEASEETKLFPGLPETFEVGTEILSQRTELQQNISVAFGGEEGKAYFANQILILADDETEAKIFADAFAGELLSYTAGVAVIELNQEYDEVKVSVKDAVMASLDPANNLPVAWPNTIYQVFEADPAMNPVNWEYQWQHDIADTTYAWDEGYDGEGVTVAVLDTGIRLGHEDLNPAMTHCTSADKETMLEEMTGIDYEISPDDIYVGHGTHVSGIIAATLDNGKGGAGIAPGVDLLSCNVFIGDMGAATDDIIEGIVWAQENGADIINMSLGGLVYNGIFATAVKQAYENGVAVFCAAGNDSTASYQYPASYEGAISIAALDKGLQKSYFSCYGDRIRYAFPGVDIYSAVCGNDTDYDGYFDEITTNSYTMMSGTSMACPVGAGVAAVVLNYAEANGMMKDLAGAAKVEKLLSVMDSAAIPVATKGLGKGTVSLSKLVGATVFEATPEVPVVVENKAGKYEAEQIEVSFEKKSNVIICYTTDGKTPQFKNGAPVGTTKIAEPTALVGGKKSVTLKAIAVNPKTGLCSKVMTAKYTFAPLPSQISFADLSGQAVLTQGESLTIKATVSPSYATNKKILWDIVNTVEGATGVTVNNKGVVKVAKNATPGFYYIVAVAEANPNVGLSYLIKVEATKKNIVSIKSEAKSYTIPLYYGTPIEGITVETNDGSVVDPMDLAWTSSNKNIAVVIRAEKLYLVGLKTGKTKITATAKDGSKKKVSFSVNVIEPIEGAHISGSKIVATGKSITLKAEAVNKVAKATDFNWTVEPANTGVTVKNGKVTASKKAVAGNYTIKAVPKDGFSDVEVTHVVTVTTDAVKSIKMDKKDTKISLQRLSETAISDWVASLPITLNGGDAWESYEVTVADSAVVRYASLTYSPNENAYYLYMEAGDSVGTTTVKVKSIDGTNKSVSVKVTVSNPISNLSITFPEGSSPDLAYTKSMKLVPVFSSENGVEKNAVKTLKWESSDPSVISVDKNGKVTAKKSDGYAIISAYSEFYSVNASMVIYASDLITKAEVEIIDSMLALNEEGEVIENGVMVLKVKTKQNGTRYLSANHYEAFNSSVDKEGLSFTHVMGYLDGELVTAAEYIINEPGTYTATFSLKDGNKIKVKHNFTLAD